MRNVLHIVLVSLQVFCLIYILATGPLLPTGFLLLILFSASLLFGLWAILEMKFRFNIFPELRQDSKFVVSGPYSLVRHPMYTSVLISSLCLVIDDLSSSRFTIWFVLFVVLFIKSYIEDKILSSRFECFAEYRERTSRLIPYIF